MRPTNGEALRTRSHWAAGTCWWFTAACWGYLKAGQILPTGFWFVIKMVLKRYSLDCSGVAGPLQFCMQGGPLYDQVSGKPPADRYAIGQSLVAVGT